METPSPSLIIIWGKMARGLLPRVTPPPRSLHSLLARSVSLSRFPFLHPLVSFARHLRTFFRLCLFFRLSFVSLLSPLFRCTLEFSSSPLSLSLTFFLSLPPPSLSLSLYPSSGFTSGVSSHRGTYFARLGNIMLAPRRGDCVTILNSL